jgi:hypothetical protein
MVAATGDRWQACAMRRRFLASIVVALAASGVSVAMGPGVAGVSSPALAQTPAVAPDAPRTMTFSWTLYPRMWAEVDLRLRAGAEAVAEVTAEGGEVTWNLHAHPIPESPATFVVLGQGVAGQASVRCAPEVSGFYSYLFSNDRAAGPVRLRVELTLRGDAHLQGIKP